MPKITFNEARKFLNDICPGDKIAIIHHNDLDGFASGILYYDWCRKKGITPEHFVYVLGTNSFKDYPLEKFNKILIADISPNFIADESELVKNKQVLYTDHHPQDKLIPEEILEYRTSDLGYIPSSRTVQELTRIKLWLGVAGTIGDAGDYYPENEEYINNYLKKEGIALEEFKENVTNIISNTLIYFEKNIQEVFQIIDKIESIENIKQLEKYSDSVENELQKFTEEYETKKEKLENVNFYFFRPKFGIKSIVVNKISSANPGEIFIVAVPKEENKIGISARNHLGKHNMSKLLGAGIANLENATAGGHTAASAGIILAKDLEKFKENIRNFAKSNFIK